MSLTNYAMSTFGSFPENTTQTLDIKTAYSYTSDVSYNLDDEVQKFSENHTVTSTLNVP
jgi:hypothetical protein